MPFRWTTLPPGLKQSISLRLESSSYRNVSRIGLCSFRRPYASAQPATRIPLAPAKSLRRYLWLLPVAGGVTLYLSPKPQSWSSTLLGSPNIIPCPEEERLPPGPVILSPSEPHIWSQILVFLHDKILEPILTARRLIHLLYLFLPVFITAPMLLVGAPEAKYGGDRWGAVWWYGFLTTQMQRAGPTFTKVRDLSYDRDKPHTCMLIAIFSWLSGQHPAPICSPLNFAAV